MRAIRKLANGLKSSLQGAVVGSRSSVELPSRGLAPESEFLVDVEGYFWSGQSPDRRVRGRLRWTPARGELQLEQMLRVVRTASTDKLDLIHGRSLLGEPICLTDCFVHRTEIAQVQYSQIWTVNGTLLGTESPQATIEGLQVRTANLRPFYGEPLFDLKDGKAEARDVLDIHWKSSPEVRVGLGDIDVVFDDYWSVAGPGSNLEITARPRLRLLSSEPKQRSELEDVLGPLLVLCGICASAPIDVQEMHLLLPGGEEVRSLGGRRSSASPADQPAPWLALGNLAPLERTLPAWISLYHEMPKALTMLAEYHRSGPNTPWEDRLLYLSRFIEQYHRNRHSSLRMSKAEFRSRRREARDKLGGQLGTWVYGISEHANERSLAERLQELVDDLGCVIADALPDPATFGKDVADTRNYYTHYSSYLEARAAKEMELVLLTKQLWLVVRALLLHEMGFDPAESRERLELDSGLSWLVKMAAEKQ